ncbi:MAG TPA: oxidoreductase [Cryomorphaceae bacterium]|nr:oxidoreductase [Cryomorphaceae bacterium]|tara:strand:- start:779 stop:2014 length:1236 start_codon:yes stop_codon:yes gene_type:complete
MESKETIYIVGAGISGLIAAYELERAGYFPIILEKSDGVGGRVRTVSIGGHRLDIGFQVLLDGYPMAKKYLDYETLNLRRLASGAQVYVDGRRYVIGDPLRDLKMLVPTITAKIGSIGDKIKVLRLNAQMKRKTIDEIFESDEMTTLEYLKNFGFSDVIIDRFFRPFFAGVFLEPELRTSSRMFEFVYKMFGQGYATIPSAGIGAISEQLKNKLSTTEFRFGAEVNKITSDKIALKTGKKIDHSGVIVTANASSLISNMRDQGTDWKSCMSLYFEIGNSNLPEETIGLIADPEKLVNNIYGYTDTDGKQILSATVLEFNGKSEKEITAKVEDEIREYCGISALNHICNFYIEQALPDLSNLKMTAQPGESILMENVFLAGDVLYNASLNAAMESGRLAAQGLLEKKTGILV